MKTYNLSVQFEFQSAARNSQLDDIRIAALVDQLFATTGLNHVAPPYDTPTSIAPGSIAAKTPPESARGEAFHLRFVMVDYYSLISRAVAALETNTFDDRRDIYNRARAVQSFHLRKLPFNKEEFNHERSVLEDAIGRVETEATTKRIVAGKHASATKRHRADTDGTASVKAFLAQKGALPSLARLTPSRLIFATQLCR